MPPLSSPFGPTPSTGVLGPSSWAANHVQQCSQLALATTEGFRTVTLDMAVYDVNEPWVDFDRVVVNLVLGIDIDGAVVVRVRDQNRIAGLAMSNTCRPGEERAKCTASQSRWCLRPTR